MSMLRSFMSLRSSERRPLLSTVSISAAALQYVVLHESDVVTETRAEAIEPLVLWLTRDALVGDDETLHVQANRRFERTRNMNL